MAFPLDLLYYVDFRTLMVFLITLMLSYQVLMQRDNRNLPPGPLMLPIVGTLITFALKERQCTSAFRAIAAWRKEYGDVFRMRFGSQEAVVICGYKRVTESLRRRKRYFDARLVVRSFECNAHCNGIVSSNGKMWRETRKFASGALRELGVGKKSLEQHIQEEASILVETFGAQTKPLYPRDILMKATANVVLKVCFGQRSEYEDAEFCEMIRNVDLILLTIGVQVLENFWPWIEYIPALAKVPTLMATDSVVRAYTMRRLHEHQATFDAAHTRDLTDLHIKERQNWQDEEMQTDFHLCRTVMDFIYAGTDTSAANMSWLILTMIRYPQIQAKCQQEIDEVVGSGRMVSLSDRPALVYNMAVMNEVMRYDTFTPLGLPREVVEDVKIGGYLVPRGAMAIFDLDSVHRDKSHWGADADEFRPERWIDEHGQLRSYKGFVPFSLGTRQCIGEPLALMEGFLFFTNLIQRLTFKLPEGASIPDMEGIQAGVTQIPKDYYIVAEHR